MATLLRPGQDGGKSSRRWRVQVAGSLVVRSPDGKDVTPRGRKARAIIACLVAQAGTKLPRERIAELLWGDRGEEQARASLRQALTEIRHAAGDVAPLVQSDRYLLWIAADDVAIEQGELGPENALFDDLNHITSEFDAWLTMERARRAAGLMTGLRRDVEGLLAKGRGAAAIPLLDRMERLDPYDEDVLRLAMQAEYQARRPAAIEQRFKQMEARTRRDLGVSVTGDTKALHDRLIAALGQEPRAPAGASPEPAAPHAAPASHAPATHSRHWPLALRIAFGVAGLTAIGLATWPLASGSQAVTVAVAGEGGDASDTLARGLRVDLSRLAGANLEELTVVDEPADARFRVNVSTSRGGNASRANLTLSGEGELLWSGAVEASGNDVGSLQSQLVGKLGNALACALHTSSGGQRLSNSTAKLFIAGCEQFDDQARQTRIQQLRRVTQEAPKFAYGWAYLGRAEAIAYADGAAREPEKRGQLQPLKQSALEHIARARALDPQIGVTYAAEAALYERHGWARSIAVLREGIRRDPKEALLHESLSFSLNQVGRTSEAIDAAKQAAALKPLSAAHRAALISSFSHGGNLAAGRRELAEAQRLWPGSSDIRNAQFSMELRYGDPRVAQTLMDRGEAGLGGNTGGFGGPQILMRARVSPTPENVARLIRFAAFEAERAPYAIGLRLQALGQFGAVEEAYQVLEQPGVIERLRIATEVLFRPHMEKIRQDRRFPAIAARLGLLTYWRSSGAWPDFCADPRLPYDCRAEAERLLASTTRR